MNNEIDDIKQLLVQTLNIDSTPMADMATEDKILEWLSMYIDDLISKDFDGLLFLLYRIDVSENKVREMLSATKGVNASKTIATLILERQKQKIYWRNKFKSSPTNIEENERW
ncbi:MAG: hypothetical protein LC105_13465 [Chitinophagales bacterium]|nr:hypothetical protein [Chitinophagales bacterium]MCZ2394866.1 hypothetical protein [Chitinophagales bacterium]